MVDNIHEGRRVPVSKRMGVAGTSLSGGYWALGRRTTRYESRGKGFFVSMLVANSTGCWGLWQTCAVVAEGGAGWICHSHGGHGKFCEKLVTRTGWEGSQHGDGASTAHEGRLISIYLGDIWSIKSSVLLRACGQ